MDHERNHFKLRTMKGEKKLECECRENRSNGCPCVHILVVVENTNLNPNVLNFLPRWYIDYEEQQKKLWEQHQQKISERILENRRNPEKFVENILNQVENVADEKAQDILLKYDTFIANPEIKAKSGRPKNVTRHKAWNSPNKPKIKQKPNKQANKKASQKQNINLPPKKKVINKTLNSKENVSNSRKRKESPVVELNQRELKRKK